MKTPCTIILLLLLVAPLRAAEPTPEETAPTETEAAATHRVGDGSSMEILRDPFWPVGYEPAPPEPEITPEAAAKIKVEQVTQSKTRWPALMLKGITRAGRKRYMALVAGVGLVETGQVISLKKDDMLYTWKIDEVSAKGVRFSRIEARPYQLPTTGVRTQ